MPALGTLAWAEETGGRLQLRDRLAQLAAALALQIRLLPAQLRWKLGLAPDQRPAIELADLRSPDTAAAKAAEDRCREVSPPYLVNHCLRAYLWGRILAAQTGLKPDDELFYVASLLHDLGLTERYANTPPALPCFAVRGATAARDMMHELGWSAARQRALAEAITLHLNVQVGLEHGVEAHLLNAGTALDVTGLRYWELSPATVRDVVGRLPRLDMKRDIWAAWKADVDAHPECRGNFLNRYLQFGSRVRGSPFAE